MVAPLLTYPAPANRAGQRKARARCALLAFALIASGCSETEAPERAEPAAARQSESRIEIPEIPTPLLVGNQLRNPGFEVGTEGWDKTSRRGAVAFEVVSEPVHSGHGAAYLVASWQPGSREKSVSVKTASQDISPPVFPDRVAGFYRVDRWEYASDEGALQLQIIVSSIGDPRTREIVAQRDPAGAEVHPDLENYQLRYQLAGPTEEPEDGGNVRHWVVAAGPPALGTWVHFDLPVKANFEERWGTVPANYRQLRVMFAVRWDDKPKGVALHADVYYDDLFFGFDDLPDSAPPSDRQR